MDADFADLVGTPQPRNGLPRLLLTRRDASGPVHVRGLFAV